MSVIKEITALMEASQVLLLPGIIILFFETQLAHVNLLLLATSHSIFSILETPGN